MIRSNRRTTPTSAQRSVRAAAARVALTVVLGLGTLAAHADEPKPGQREREVLRRSQQALRDAQEQQAALQREKATVLQEKARLEADAKAAGKQAAASQAQARGLRADLARAQAEVERLTGELQVAKAQAAQAQTAAGEREKALVQRLDRLQQQLAERTGTAHSLSQLLARSTEGLAQAEKKNRELYALSQKLLAMYRDKGVGEVLAHKEPVLGLGAVKLDNLSEELRAQADALRVAQQPSE